MNQNDAPVVVRSDTLTEQILLKLTPAQKRFAARQAQAEMRSTANYIRSLIVERMQG
jgi:hypothetical protein